MARLRPAEKRRMRTQRDQTEQEIRRLEDRAGRMVGHCGALLREQARELRTDLQILELYVGKR